MEDLVEEVVEFEPLADAFHVDLGAAQLLPVVVAPALLLGRAAKLARVLEHVAHQRVAADLSVQHLRQPTVGKQKKRTKLGNKTR